MEKPLINGKRHAWAQIRINLLGRTVTGVTSIEYGDNVAKEDHRGAGAYPTHRGNGDYTADNPKLKLAKYEVEAIQDALEGKRLQDVEAFDIIVHYKPIGQDVARTDRLRNCEFMNNKRSSASGDTNIEMDFDLICSHVLWHGMKE